MEETNSKFWCGRSTPPISVMTLAITSHTVWDGGSDRYLAMLYVAKISEQPRTIIIDEPGSFLHPGASRALMGILKGFSQHQYIIATHSPEIIGELSDAPVSIIRWVDSQSVVEQFTRTTSKIAATSLTEIGARLSDLLGFDKVLWVRRSERRRPTGILLAAAPPAHASLRHLAGP